MSHNTTPVLSKGQALQVTGGREPMVPAEYEAALKAVQSCIDIDEGKYWSDKADALAAWAKIHRSNDLLRKAKVLKLHAYRRMSQIAEELRPFKGGKPETGGRAGGPNSYLREQGFTKTEAVHVRAVGRAPEPTFQTAIRAENPPSPAWFKQPYTEVDSARAKLLTFYGFRDLCRTTKPKDLAEALSSKDIARKAITEITEWLDRLEQLL